MLHRPTHGTAHRRWRDRTGRKFPRGGMRGTAWLDNANRLGLTVVEHDRASGRLWCRGKVSEVDVDLVRHPLHGQTRGHRDWTLRARDPRLSGGIGFRPEYTALKGLLSTRDYTTGDSEFDAAVRLSGEPVALCAALSSGTRKMIARWVRNGATLTDGEMHHRFRAGEFDLDVLRGVLLRAVRLLRRLGSDLGEPSKRLLQVSAHDPEPGVRAIALRHALSGPDGPLYPGSRATWTPRGAMYQALMAAAHSDHEPLKQLAGVHLAPAFSASALDGWSESMLLCVAEHGHRKADLAEVIGALGEVGGQRSLEFLVDYASGWFGMRKGAKTAEAVIASLMQRLGGDRKGAVSLVEPLAEGSLSLIDPLTDDDD